MLLILETIDLNGIHSLYSLSNRLNLDNVLPNKVTIWKLRNNNPLRKSHVTNNIKNRIKNSSAFDDPDLKCKKIK